jgi:uncharacterized protein (DUF1810 family)
MSTDPDNGPLARFLEAQDGVYPAALSELRSGSKRTHWMWFIFPQIDGLGTSPTAQKFAISGLDEAKAYINHPVLGCRLLECCRALLALPGTSATAVMGYPDDIKLRSSMTLFALAADDHPEFEAVLAKFFGGQRDDKTIELAGR